MSIVVKSIDEQAILKKIKRSGDIEVIEYVNSLKQSIEMWKNIAQKAIKNLTNGTKAN